MGCGDLVEEAKDLATDVLSSCLVLVHNARRRGEHNEAELLGRQQSVAPATNLPERNIKPRADAAALRGVRAVWDDVPCTRAPTVPIQKKANTKNVTVSKCERISIVCQCPKGTQTQGMGSQQRAGQQAC